VRAGCLVISYSTLPDSQGSTREELQKQTAAAFKEWAQEFGLIADHDDSTLSVQVWISITKSLWVP